MDYALSPLVLSVSRVQSVISFFVFSLIAALRSRLPALLHPPFPRSTSSTFASSSSSGACRPFALYLHVRGGCVSSSTVCLECQTAQGCVSHRATVIVPQGRINNTPSTVKLWANPNTISMLELILGILLKCVLAKLLQEQWSLYLSGCCVCLCVCVYTLSGYLSVSKWRCAPTLITCVSVDEDGRRNATLASEVGAHLICTQAYKSVQTLGEK